MSVGAAPMSDEDLLALRQPPSIVPAPDPVVEGPSPTPPDFIDQVNAQPLAAPVSGAAPDENAFPPPVPPEAPGMVPMPPPLPGAPPAPGAKPPGTPGAPASPKDALAQADQDVRDAATGAATAREKADQAQITAAEGGADEAHAAHNAAIDALANRQDEIDRTEKLQAQYEEADKRAQQAVDEAAKARKNFSFRSYWADKSSATRIASALFQALGAFGAGLTRGPNYALQILDKDMDDDHRAQVERLQQLSDDEVRARTGLSDSREARKQALLQIQTNAAQGDAMIAAQLRAASAKSTDDNFKKNVDAFAAKLQQDSAQKLLEARAAVRNGIIKEQDDAAKRAEQEARTRYLNARAGHVARGTGAGSGASPAQGTAAATLSKMISEKAPYQDLVAKANELGFPLEAKVGRPSLKSLIASSGAMSTQGTRDERLVDREVTQWEGDNGIRKIAEKQRELSSLLKEWKDNAHNPLQQALAVEKAVSAARGGAASKQALSLALDHLGGSFDKADAIIAKIRSGELGEKQRQNFEGFLRGQLGAAQAEGKEKYDAYGKMVESAPDAKRQALLNARGRVFSGLAGFGGASGGGGVDQAKVARARAAIAPGSSATPAQRANAEAYLRQAGAI